MVLASRVHPSVAKIGQTLLSGANIVYNGNPINDLSLGAFLDKFMEKKPKANRRAEGTWHGGSQIAPARKPEVRNQLIGAEILSLAEEDAPAEDLIFHKFYMNKTSSSKKTKKKKKKQAEDAAAEDLVDADVAGDDESDDEEVDKILGSVQMASENSTSLGESCLQRFAVRKRFIVLNAADMIIEDGSVSFQCLHSGKEVYRPLQVALVEEDEILVLGFGVSLPLREGILVIRFTGTLNDQVKGFCRSVHEHNGNKKSKHADINV